MTQMTQIYADCFLICENLRHLRIKIFLAFQVIIHATGLTLPVNRFSLWMFGEPNHREVTLRVLREIANDP
jgi:hypothetical protein